MDANGDDRGETLHTSISTSTGLALVVLVLTACGVDDEDGDTARVAELEEELAEAREETAAREAELEEEREELAAARETLEAERADEDEPDADEVEPAPMRTPEGLVDQLRQHTLDVEDLPEGWEPGTTEWTAFELPDGLEGTYDDPGRLVLDLAHELDGAALGLDLWESTARVLLDEDDQDLAYGAVLSWGFADDAVIGRDVRVTLTRDDDGRWEPGGAEQRSHCARGITDDGTLCS